MEDAFLHGRLREDRGRLPGRHRARSARPCCGSATGCDPGRPGHLDQARAPDRRHGAAAVRRTPPTPLSLHAAFDLLVGAGRWAPRAVARLLPAALPARAGAGRRGLAHRGRLPTARRADLLHERTVPGPGAADAVPVHRRRRGRRADPYSGGIPSGRAGGAARRTASSGTSVFAVGGRDRRGQRAPAARPVPPAAPATSSSATPSWCTPRSRTTAAGRVSWPSRRCTRRCSRPGARGRRRTRPSRRRSAGLAPVWDVIG